jgi:hypothetical protein
MRSPLFYPLNRGMDAEAGGAADLQTDVMRFMAILSLCLVAIFALVQSIPLAPIIETPPTIEKADDPPKPTPKVEQPQPVSEPEVIPERAITLTRPHPRKMQPREPAPVLQRPAPEAAPAEVLQNPAPPIPQMVESVEAPPIEPEPPQEGFTLRFEDDVALTRLVSRNDVGLYVILPDKSFRMNVSRGEMSFWPASTPNEFHEMDASTVPNAVVDAFTRSNSSRGRDLQWGVTIPAGTTRQLDQYLRESSGGALIIDADGGLRLER